MKLSPDAASGSGAKPWIPAEMETNTSPLSEDGVQSMLDLFKKTPGALNLRGSNGSKVIKAAAGEIGSTPWLPGEALVIVNQMNSGEWIPASSWGGVETPTSALHSARREAERIIAEAKSQAELILVDTRNQADTLILNAHQEGWQAAEAETEGMLSTARAIVEQISGWRDEMLAKSQEEVLEMIRVIAQRMFGEGIVLPSETLQEAFNQALQDARSLGDLRLYVHPQDATRLDPYWRDFQVAVGGHQMKIIPSEAIRRGGCFIDGQLGSVDARVETQLKSIMEVLGSEKDQTEKAA
jgi:flagellar biosynthesis/type III secretory pathway protein FliH